MRKSSCSLCHFWQSSIGKKIIVAVTGAVLVAFLLGHLSGNLLMYMGADAFNAYAEFLHGMLHGAGVWIARIVLLACLALHVFSTICLVRQNKVAKGEGYKKEETNVASASSRIMIWSGLTILAFVVFHILHYTVRIDSELAALAEKPDAYGNNNNAYAMVIEGFKSPLVSIFYIIAITLLCSHLSHGVASIFQTLGLRTRGNAKLIEYSAKAYTAIIWVGFISIPVAVLAGILT